MKLVLQLHLRNKPDRLVNESSKPRQTVNLFVGGKQRRRGACANRHDNGFSSWC